jgi:hypothetical protein
MDEGIDMVKFRLFIQSLLICGAAISLTRSIALATDFQSPRTMGIGGAGHAAPLLNDSIYMNPSFGSFLPTYSISANYLFFDGPVKNTPAGPMEQHGRNYNASLQDGRSELFQAGVGYTHRDDASFVHVGASRAVIQRLGVGLGGKFYFNTATHSSGRDMTFSVSGIPLDFLNASFVIDNLIQYGSGIPHGLYREFILGTKVNIQNLVLIYFDPHLVPDYPVNGERFGHELGLEIPLMSDLFIRFGNFRNALVPFEAMRGRGWTLGAGWVGPKVSLDYAMSRVIESQSAIAHNFGMTIYF